MTDGPVDAPRSVVLDEGLVSALRVAVRCLEESVASARTSAEITGSAAPEVALFRAAAERLRAVVVG